MSSQISPERLATYKACLEDGWSFSQIQQTYRVDWRTLNRHFPKQGWTKKQGAELGNLLMKAGKA